MNRGAWREVKSAYFPAALPAGWEVGGGARGPWGVRGVVRGRIVGVGPSRLWAGCWEKLRVPVRVGLLSVLLVGPWGCDSGLEGPGELQAALQGPVPALGAALLEVKGQGITGFSSSDDARIFWAPLSFPDNTYRVLVVRPTPGTLRFLVAVQDRGGPKPSASVIQVVTGDNLPIAVTDQYRVVFSRP